jgi:hypothetical protein
MLRYFSLKVTTLRALETSGTAALLANVWCGMNGTYERGILFEEV